MRSGKPRGGSRRATAGRVTFWSSFALAAYTYAGYPVMLWLLNRLLDRDCSVTPDEAGELPSVAIVVAARNEAGTIEHLLHSCAALDYPAGRMHMVTVLDHCTDSTREAVEACRAAFEELGVRFSVLETPAERAGKAAAVDAGVRASNEEVVVFTDANVRLDAGAVRALVRPFASPETGGVCGRRLPLRELDLVSGQGDRAYWSYEAWIKGQEGLLASVAGADGALYAIRRACYRPVSGCADDLAISLNVVRDGKRLRFAADAIAYESSTRRLGDEFRRRRRTQSCSLAELIGSRDLLSPSRTAFAWILLSHKLLRYVVPYGLLGLMAGSVFAGGQVYKILGAAQALGYGAAVLGGVAAQRRYVSAGAAVPLYALGAQVAAALAPLTLWRRPRDAWTPTPR